MARVTYVEADGTRHEVEVPAGNTVMEGAFKNGIEGIEAECGGACACATCHCYVDENWVGAFQPPKDEELEMLEFAKSEFKDTSRLSCQLSVTDAHDGLVVYLPELQ